MSRRAIGCKNLYYAVGTVAQDGAITYGTPKRIIGLQELSTTNNYAEYQFYSDNKADESGKNLVSVDITAIIKGLDPEIEAELMGKSYEDGVLTTNVNDKQAVVALMYEITTLGASYFRVLYNCKLAKDELSSTGESDSIESDDVTLTGSAIANEEGVVERLIDGAILSTASIITNFFKEVYKPGNESKAIL